MLVPRIVESTTQLDPLGGGVKRLHARICVTGGPMAQESTIRDGGSQPPVRGWPWLFQDPPMWEAVSDRRSVADSESPHLPARLQRLKRKQCGQAELALRRCWRGFCRRAECASHTEEHASLSS